MYTHYTGKCQFNFVWYLHGCSAVRGYHIDKSIQNPATGILLGDSLGKSCDTFWGQRLGMALIVVCPEAIIEGDHFKNSRC